MTRDELITRTRQLVAEGDRLQADPSLRALQTWLQLSDDLLSAAWGSMDRYHLAWLMVGKPKKTVRGRQMTRIEEAVYVATCFNVIDRLADAFDFQPNDERGLRWVARILLKVGYGAGSVPG